EERAHFTRRGLAEGPLGALDQTLSEGRVERQLLVQRDLPRRGEAERLGRLLQREALPEGLEGVGGFEERQLALAGPLDRDQDVVGRGGVRVAAVHPDEVEPEDGLDRLADAADREGPDRLIERADQLVAAERAEVAAPGRRAAVRGLAPGDLGEVGPVEDLLP